MQLSYFHFTMNQIRLIFFQKKREEKTCCSPLDCNRQVYFHMLHSHSIGQIKKRCSGLIKSNSILKSEPIGGLASFSLLLGRGEEYALPPFQAYFKIRANWRVGILLSPFRPRRRVRPPSLLGLQEEYKFRDFFGCQDIIIQYIDSNIQHPDSNVQRDGSLVKGELSLACQK